MPFSSPVSIVIVGYGRMGKAVGKVCEEQNLSIQSICHSLDELRAATFKQPAVAVVFTTSPTLTPTLEVIAQHHMPMVCGSTGWQETKPQIQKLIKDYGIPCVMDSNFSLGIHLLNEMATLATTLTDPHNYKIAISEIHHRHKKDKPSGTALNLVQRILAYSRSKTSFSKGSVRNSHQKIALSSRRQGAGCGTHRVSFSSTYERLEVKHVALHRTLFAQGAVRSALWLYGKRGLFSFSDVVRQEAHFPPRGLPLGASPPNKVRGE